MVGHGGSSAGWYPADPTPPIPSHCASIVAISTLRVNYHVQSVEIWKHNVECADFMQRFVLQVMCRHKSPIVGKCKQNQS